jgi:hypothetical protein
LRNGWGCKNEMKILYVGNSKTIMRNLEELGAERLTDLKDPRERIDGIIISKDLPPDEMESLKSLGVPIVLSSGRKEYQKNIDVLVLDEDEMNTFCGVSEWDIAKCRDQIRKLGIKHLVVALGKKEVKRRIELLQISRINVKEVKVTDKEVERAKDVITAIIAYIYIKEGLLVPDSIERAKVGAILEVSGMKKDASCHHLKFNLKRTKEGMEKPG